MRQLLAAVLASVVALALLCVVGCDRQRDAPLISKNQTSFTDYWNRKWTCEPCPEMGLNVGDTLVFAPGLYMLDGLFAKAKVARGKWVPTPPNGWHWVSTHYGKDSLEVVWQREPCPEFQMALAQDGSTVTEVALYGPDGTIVQRFVPEATR